MDETSGVALALKTGVPSYQIETRIGNHTFRATGITAYLKNSGKLEVAQQIANHESPRTTKLYDLQRRLFRAKDRSVVASIPVPAPGAISIVPPPQIQPIKE